MANTERPKRPPLAPALDRSQSVAGGDGRDQLGRFVKGCKPGPGRPPRAVEADYIRSVSAAVPPERMAAIAAKVADLAEAGDATALAWLGRWLLERAPSLPEAHLADLRQRLAGVEAVLVQLAHERDQVAPVSLDDLGEHPAEREARILRMAHALRAALDAPSDPADGCTVAE